MSDEYHLEEFAVSTRCRARKRNCECGYRFKLGDSPLSDGEKPEDRNDPDYDMARLGVCPECGRPRPLCSNPATAGRHVCRLHGGHAGRKPASPLIRALEDPLMEEVIALQQAKADTLDLEFYTGLHMVQSSLGNYRVEVQGGSPPNLDTIDQILGQIDKIHVLKERREKLKLMVPAGDVITKIKFDDPRFQYLLQEQFRKQEQEAVRGTVMYFLKMLLEKPDILKEFIKALPEGFQPYAESFLDKHAEIKDVIIERESEPESRT